MSSPLNTNPDGYNMTTPGELGTVSDGHDIGTSEGGLMTLDGQSAGTNVQNVMMFAENLMGVQEETGGDPLALDDPLLLASSPEEVMMMAGVDPIMMSTNVSTDEAVLSESSGTPLKSVMTTPLTPIREFHSMGESTPDASGLECANKVRDASDDRDTEIDVRARGRRVVGRKLVVVEDEDEAQSSMSVSSAGEDVMTTSSSKAAKKGIKRGRRTGDKNRRTEDRTEEESSEGKKKKRKGKKKATRKDTPEEEETDGKNNEPKGIVEHAIEDMSSSVLGGAISEWANRIDEIRVKSKNLQGKLNGEMKKCVLKIKEGTAVLVARTMATGDSQFLRMRNNELMSQVLELENENARLNEQLRKMSLGPSPPRRKRKMDKVVSGVDTPQDVSVDLGTPKEKRVVPALVREEFPPLPQRPPRGTVLRGGPPPVVPGFSTAIYDSEGTDVLTGAEAYFTQHIDFLVAARERERERKEKQGKKQVGPQHKVRENRDEGRKIGPRIVSDIQVAPPFKGRFKEVASPLTPSGSEIEWKVVRGGGRGGRGRSDKPPPPSSPFPASGTDPSVGAPVIGVKDAGDRARRRPPFGQQPKVRPPRPPMSSAVTITGRAEGFSYATALKNAREHIDLEALGIRTSRVRKAVNGGMLIEVSGEDSKVKAEELMARLRGILKDSAVVSCPIKKRELRVIGFDESVTSDEIVEALCNLGGCSKEDVKTGPIRTMNNGLGIVWVQLPVAAAARVADEGRIRIGWTVARVELLKARPLQCYRCWSFGHVQSACRSVIDRRGACFKCGQRGHVASVCKNPVHCVVCHDTGLEAFHRLGGPQCMAQVRHDALLSERRPIATIR